MTINHSSALNEDLVPAQEKLEWVTPKISLMDAGNSLGAPKDTILNSKELTNIGFKLGPS